MNKKEPFRRYLIISFIFATIVFLLGVGVGFYISQGKISKFEELGDEIANEIKDQELLEDIAITVSCNLESLQPVTEDLNSLGKRLSYLEDKFGYNHQSVLRLRESYSILELRHLLILREFKKRCSIQGINTIIFFFSNKKEFKEESIRQGIVLTYAKNSYPNNVFIYSFDFDQDLESVKSLKNSYNATKVPFVIINDQSYKDFLERDLLLEIIKEKINRKI